MLTEAMKRAAMIISATIFDAFGTLLRIREGSHPYRKLLKLGVQQGRRPLPSDAAAILSNPLDLKEAADYFGIHVASSFMNRLEGELQDDLDHIEAYPDGIAATAALQAARVKVIVCSNLAKPYASAIERLYPQLDGYVYSFAVGAIKPSFEIYDRAARLASFPLSQICMIGDSKRCDCDGPADLGMRGYFLDRAGDGDYQSLSVFATDILGAQ